MAATQSGWCHSVALCLRCWNVNKWSVSVDVALQHTAILAVNSRWQVMCQEARSLSLVRSFTSSFGRPEFIGELPCDSAVPFATNLFIRHQDLPRMRGDGCLAHRVLDCVVLLTASLDTVFEIDLSLPPRSGELSFFCICWRTGWRPRPCRYCAEARSKPPCGKQMGRPPHVWGFVCGQLRERPYCQEIRKNRVSSGRRSQ